MAKEEETIQEEAEAIIEEAEKDSVAEEETPLEDEDFQGVDRVEDIPEGEESKYGL